MLRTQIVSPGSWKLVVFGSTRSKSPSLRRISADTKKAVSVVSGVEMAGRRIAMSKSYTPRKLDITNCDLNFENIGVFHFS